MSDFEIKKMEPDKMLVFGWANVSARRDGEVIEDFQQDVIEPEDLENAAYAYVLNFRAAGEMHDPGLRERGWLVESCVFTKEKQTAIGIPEGNVPEGWWVGFKIDDPVTWEKIKNGEFRMFSIEGTGEREPLGKMRAVTYRELRQAKSAHNSRL